MGKTNNFISQLELPANTDVPRKNNGSLIEEEEKEEDEVLLPEDLLKPDKQKQPEKQRREVVAKPKGPISKPI